MSIDRTPDMVFKIKVFGWQSCPDINIETSDSRLAAVEVKLSSTRKRVLIKEGLGQAVIYRALYDYAILFVAYRPWEGLDPGKHELDKTVKSLLWNNVRLGLIVRHEENREFM